MNRPEFHRSIIDPSDTSVEGLFDTIMALYNIVPDDYTSVTISDDKKSFHVTFKSAEQARALCTFLNNRQIRVYETQLHIICEYDDQCSITVSFTKM